MNDIWTNSINISPSLICLDMCNILKQVEELERNGIQMLHIDILDGHFSPSMPLGLELVKQLREYTSIAFDCHLMVDNPEFFVEELLGIGVEQILFHMETAKHVDGLLNKIRSAGVRTGVALKPATSLSQLDYVIEECDTVLLMMINPGYASFKGETTVPYKERKIQDLHNMIRKSNLPVKIEIDGRVSEDDIKIYGGKEVDIFVCGTSCIDKSNITDSINKLKKLYI